MLWLLLTEFCPIRQKFASRNAAQSNSWTSHPNASRNLFGLGQKATLVRTGKPGITWSLVVGRLLMTQAKVFLFLWCWRYSGCYGVWVVLVAMVLKMRWLSWTGCYGVWDILVAMVLEMHWLLWCLRCIGCYGVGLTRIIFSFWRLLAFWWIRSLREVTGF